MIVGCDPGKTGGLVAMFRAPVRDLVPGTEDVRWGIRMPAHGTQYDEPAIAAWFRRVKATALDRPCILAIEQPAHVRTFPKRKRVCPDCGHEWEETESSLHAKATSSLFESAGIVRGVAAVHGFEIRQVTTHEWQKIMLAGHNVKTRADRQKAILLQARRKYTDLPLKHKKDDGIAAAALIAEYCMRRMNWETEPTEANACHICETRDK